jgi:gentisate 1,2-dioxygenase
LVEGLLSQSPKSLPSGTQYDAVRQGWLDAHVRPLWENPRVHKAREGGAKAHLWAWRTLRPLVEDAMRVTSPAAVERRVLTLVDPENDTASSGTTTNLTAALQILLPGETARPHRHTPNALRFMIEGSGAVTVVDGKLCPMEPGDLVITPGWSWHEHIHNGTEPVIWLDALDAPLHRAIGTDVFEPGPPHDLPNHPDDAAFAAAGVVPEMAGTRPSSPVFRYPWAAAANALRAAPIGKEGARRVRYVNPLTGGPAMPLLDCYLTAIGKGIETVRFRSNGNAICYVCEGRGASRVGGETLAWESRDVFSLPHGNWIVHRAEEDAILFVVTDRDALQRLGLLKEEFGNVG